METTEFSEFSYGYALTDSFMNGDYSVSAIAPRFPNLKEEGLQGGGYDVKIPTCPVPLFLQFKIPQIISRSSRLKPEEFSVPYYRMHLRTQHTNQHAMLRSLESAENLVYYATPLFDSNTDLDEHCSSHAVVEHSAFFSPNDIGEMDSTAHHVAYDRYHDYGVARSDPKKLKQPCSGKAFLSDLQKAADSAREVKPQNFIANTQKAVVHAIINNFTFGQKEPMAPNEVVIVEIGDPSLESISYLAGLFLGCEFFVIGKTAREMS